MPIRASELFSGVRIGTLFVLRNENPVETAGFQKSVLQERAATTQLCQVGLGKLPNKHMRAESRNGRAG
jgi:hypothetical protein